MSNVQYPGAGGVANTDFKVVRAYYTNLNSSASPLNLAIKPGYVMCCDVWNTAPLNASSVGNSVGAGVNQPETNNLSMFAGIVVGANLPPGTDGTPNAGAGFVDLVKSALTIQAWTKSSQTLNVTGLGPVAGQWYLGTITTSVASGAANLAALAQIVALAQSTVDTSTTAANAPVKLGILGGS
jgi:hypothetical protein